MKHLLTGIFLLVTLAWGAKTTLPALDSVYHYYAEENYTQAAALLEQLRQQKLTPEQRFAVLLELGDYYLDKSGDYHHAESIYQSLLTEYPKHPQTSGLLYRLAITQELQEKFLEAAKNYELVATRYIKSAIGQDALEAIERCFRKNYQERVASVNGYPITRIELDDRISRNPTAYETFDKKLALLDTMINNRLLYEGAIAANIHRAPLVIRNLTDIKNRLMFQTWYEENVTSKAEPKEKELRASYARNRAKYTTPERVHGYQLVVTSRTTAESLRKILVADPTQWDSLVKKYSILPDRERGGDMGFFARGTHPREIENAAFRLKPGEISMPVAIRDTYYIIRITHREPRKVKPYEELKNQLAVELRQERTNKIYEQEIARLKKTAAVIQDTAALEQNKETLASVRGTPITRTHLEAKLNAIPPFFRGQFETPEGKQRILEQLIIEKLLLRECEKEKYWLRNRVIDQWLSRRSAILIDTYRRNQTTEKVVLDSAALMAEYQATINDFKEPTRVRCRELVVKTRQQAERLRSWAVTGKIPPLISGIVFLVKEEPKAQQLAADLAQTTNIDSLAALGGLAEPNLRLPGIPTQLIGTKELIDLTQKSLLAGPFIKSELRAFAFANLTPDDQIYAPELIEIQTPEQLQTLLGEKEKPAFTKETFDSTRIGTYARLSSQLPLRFTKELFQLPTGGVSTPYKTAAGYLVVKITAKDTAQKVEFVELIRRFSTSGSKWAGGEISLTRDDKARDKKVVDAAYRLTKGAYSPVLKLNDTTYTFIKMEEKKPAYTRPFAEVRTKIENKLRREKEKTLSDQLINDLRTKAKIEILMKEEDFKTEEPTPLPSTQPEQK